MLTLVPYYKPVLEDTREYFREGNIPKAIQSALIVIAGSIITGHIPDRERSIATVSDIPETPLGIPIETALPQTRREKVMTQVRSVVGEAREANTGILPKSLYVKIVGNSINDSNILARVMTTAEMAIEGLKAAYDPNYQLRQFISAEV